MGNTPSQQPFEDETSKAGDPDAGDTVFGRVAAAVRSLFVGVRRRWTAVVEEDGPGTRSSDGDGRGQQSTDSLVPARTERSLPAREQPFTRPPTDGDRSNALELEAREEDGRLSIYYPDHDGAKITSDTWQRVER